MPVETSGRFIEDEDSRRKVDRAGDCHDVLDRDGIAAERDYIQRKLEEANRG